MEHGVIIMNTYQMVITGNYIPANSSGGTYTYTSVYIYIYMLSTVRQRAVVSRTLRSSLGSSSSSTALQ